MARFLNLSFATTQSRGRANYRSDDALTDGDDDDDGGVPLAVLFSMNLWTEGSGFSPDGVEPEWGFPADTWAHDIGIPIPSSIPSDGLSVPLVEDDIGKIIRASAVLLTPHIDQIVDTLNSGSPNKVGDLALFPTLARFTPPDEDYEFFQIIVNAPIVDLPERRVAGEGAAGGTPRTRVIAIAFGNGTGGYVAQAPATNDTFAGAQVWMKATRNPVYGTWGMDQRDWRTGSGAAYATSLRMIMRDDAVVAVIKRSELDELGVTQYRWDTFSYTTNASTEWSHDYTDWLPID